MTIPPDVSPHTPERHRRLTTDIQHRRPPPLQQARRESTGGNIFALLDISDEDHEDTDGHGYVEVQVRLDGAPFQPIVKHWTPDECPKSYDEFEAEGMPPGAFLGRFLAPDPVQGQHPVFAVHGNFIKGGVFVVISLHHSVADVHGLAAVVHSMSSTDDMSPASEASLHADAKEQSRIRDRLSGSRGVKASHLKHSGYNKSVTPLSNISTKSTPLSCRILTFDLDKVLEVTEMVNERSALGIGQPFAKVRPIECLIAMLWKAITRARRLRTESEHQSNLKVEVDMRRRMDPPLHNYIGNACFPAIVEAPGARLNLPVDVGTLTTTSQNVHGMIAAVTESQMRSVIAAINEVPDIRRINRNPVLTDSDVLVTDWSGLPIEGEATMGLGLGDAQYVRSVSSDQPSHGCRIMPQRHGAWDVVVQYDEEILGHLLDEEVGVPFVLRVV